MEQKLIAGMYIRKYLSSWCFLQSGWKTVWI